MNIVLTRSWSDAIAITPSLGLAYLSSYLKMKGHKCHIVDALRDDVRDPQKTVDEILSYDPDLVGVTAFTATYFSATEIVRRVNHEGIPTMMGGAHPSCLPEQTLEETNCDWVVAGEGETAVERIIAGEKPGVVYGEPVDITKVPWPDWDEVYKRKWPHVPCGGVTKNKPVGVIVTTRGCPYKCSFCAAHYMTGKGMRWRDPIDVVDEMECLIHHYGMRELNVQDDNFTVRRSHAEAICNEILRRGLTFSWGCENGIRADRVDLDLLKLMKRAGCYRVAFGVESPNERVLSLVEKKESVEDIEKAINNAKKAGLYVRGCFIVGLPGETKDTLRNTAEWARRSKLNEANFTMLDILPGSQLWNDLQGKFKPDWTKNSFKTPEYIPEGLTQEDLKLAQRNMFRRFYTVPSHAWGVISKMRPAQVKRFAKRLKDYHVV